MRRRRPALIAIGGGGLLAVLTVALPVGLAPFLPAPTPVSGNGVRLPYAPAEYPDPNITWTHRRPGLVEESSIRGIGVYDSWHVTRVRAGWPLPMLEGGSYCEIHSQGGEAASGTIHPVALKSWWSGDFKRHWQLPTGLVWGGLGALANWAVWSAVIAACFLPRTIKRAGRRRRGECLACGYPSPSGGTCPECGRQRGA